jgi:hypothetical protein
MRRNSGEIENCLRQALRAYRGRGYDRRGRGIFDVADDRLVSRGKPPTFRICSKARTHSSRTSGDTRSKDVGTMDFVLHPASSQADDLALQVAVGRQAR